MPQQKKRPLEGINTYETVCILINTLKDVKRSSTNNIRFNSALDEAINKLTNLKQYF